MTEKEFKNIYSQKISEIYNFALKNEHSDFYRNKYQIIETTAANLKYADFLKLPLLTKDEILTIPLEKRSFLDTKTIRRFNLSSGTTNNKVVLAIPLSDYEKPSSKPYSLNSLDVENKKCLVLFPPMSAAFFSHLMGVNRKGGISIPGDVHNFKRTALVVKELQPEIFFTTPTILDFLVEELKEINFDFKAVKVVSLGGENTSKLKAEYFKNIFNQAKIVFRYGSSETGGQRGYRCKYIADRSPDIYHPADAFIEVVNNNGEVLPDGQVGEIVHTDLISPKGFPFIRYRTGDIGSTYFEECPCGNNRLIRLGGRANHDILKFSGITLYAEQIEKSLAEFSSYILPTFEMHVYEELISGKIMPKLILKLATQNNESQITTKIIEKTVLEKLYLSANKNLKYFVENEIFLPLEVIFVNKDELNSTKKTGIISHLN